MPEGDTIFRAARTLHRALAGSPVTRFESAFPALNRIDDDRPLAGRTIESVSARGKHLLMMFSGDLVLRTHMKMHGSWHIYRLGERWRRPARDMRIVVETARFVAVGFNVPVAEFLTGRELSRHQQLGALGPDLLAPMASAGPAGPSFDRAEVLRRIRTQGNTAIAEVLLNQRVVAGIGNVFKSEILFVAGIDPFTPASELSDAVLARLIDEAQQLLRANVLDRVTDALRRDRTADNPQPRSRREALGLRPWGKAVPDLRDPDSHEKNRTGRAERRTGVRSVSGAINN